LIWKDQPVRHTARPGALHTTRREQACISQSKVLLVSAKPPWCACFSQHFRPTCCWKSLKKTLSSAVSTRPFPLRIPDTDFLPAQPLPPAAPWHPEALPGGGHLISDYTFEKDALFARINLQGDELEMYHRVHEALAEKIPAAQPAGVPARRIPIC
jgi:hypothetical protein